MRTMIGSPVVVANDAPYNTAMQSKLVTKPESELTFLKPRSHLGTGEDH
jgi:hypothetical protein